MEVARVEMALETGAMQHAVRHAHAIGRKHRLVAARALADALALPVQRKGIPLHLLRTRQKRERERERK